MCVHAYVCVRLGSYLCVCDINLDMGLHINADLSDDILENLPKPPENVLNSPVKLEEPQKQPSNILATPVKCDFDYYGSNRVSESSDQSEKEIGKYRMKKTFSYNCHPLLISFCRSFSREYTTGFMWLTLAQRFCFEMMFFFYVTTCAYN